MKKRIVTGILSLSVLLSGLCLSACEINTSLSKNTDDSALSEESSEPSATDDTEPTVDPFYQSLKDEAEKYMSSLVLGDADVTAETFGLRRGEVLYPTYEFDDYIYALLFKDISYSYGSYLTKDNSDYSLYVTAHIPDLMSCVEQVRNDRLFIYENGMDWILAATGPDRELQNQCFSDLMTAVFAEAVRRIEAGEYTETVLRTDCFTFHDNGDAWVFKGMPDFITMCDSTYMYKLIPVDPFTEYDMLSGVGTIFVQAGVVSEEALTAAQVVKAQEISELYAGDTET